MFSLCASMKWNHLPEAGGLHAQHPALLEGFEVIFAAQAEEDEKRRKAEERKAQANKAKRR